MTYKEDMPNFLTAIALLRLSVPLIFTALQQIINSRAFNVHYGNFNRNAIIPRHS